VTGRAIDDSGAGFHGMQINPVKRMDLSSQIVAKVAQTASVVGFVTRLTRGFISVSTYSVILTPACRMDLLNTLFWFQMTGFTRHSLLYTIMTQKTGLHAGTTRLRNARDGRGAVTGEAVCILKSYVQLM